MPTILMILSSNKTKASDLFLLRVRGGQAGTLLIILCAATFFLYYPGIFGPFLLDDFPNLEPLSFNGGVTSIHNLLSFIFSNESGKLGRPVSMLSFLINDQYWPGYAPVFKYTNVLIHLLVGVLIFIFSRQVIRSLCQEEDKDVNLFALFATAFWLLHPLNVSTTLYVIQRMTQLSSLFSLLAIILYLHGRQYLMVGSAKGFIYVGLAFFPVGLAGILSKENAILLIPLILLLDCLLPKGNSYRSIQYSNFIKYVVLMFPLVVLLGYFAANASDIAAGYQKREFEPLERILTEARVLCDYLSKIFLPRASGLSLFHDDFQISSSVFNPISTVFAIIFLCALVFTAFLLKKKQPLLLFAVAWFLIAHSLESTLIPLEIYFEHRNYLPMIGPVLFASYSLIKILNWVFCKTVIFRNLILISILAVQALMLNITARTWSDSGLLFYSWAIEHPDSLRSQRAYAEYLESIGLLDHAIKVLDDAYRKHSYDISLLISKLNIQCRLQSLYPLTVSNIINGSKDARFTDGVLYYLQGLTENVIAGNCRYFGVDDMHILFDYVENLPLLKSKSKYAAKVYYLHSDLYVHQHNLQGAMDRLNKVFELQPTVDVALKQAVLLTSASLYDQALERVNAAMLADKNRRLLMPSRIAEINQLENFIRNQQKIESDAE